MGVENFSSGKTRPHGKTGEKNNDF